eukprot:m.441758 g.441758  ORF g.441758 m.441758 type:complete len:230 (-) comp18702_c0_seq1:117-806(-)
MADANNFGDVDGVDGAGSVSHTSKMKGDQEGYVDVDGVDDDGSVSPTSSGSPGRPPVPPKEGGWAAQSPKKGRRKQGSDPEARPVDARLTMEAPPDGNETDVTEGSVDPDSDDDIPRIADINEKKEEDLTLQVADAPTQQVQVTTIASLDMDLVSTMPLMQTVDNYQQQHKINLKLLTKALNSTKMISEADEPWTNLFSEVKSEMQTERETRDALENATQEDLPDLPSI